jgi:hypothetical protein
MGKVVVSLRGNIIEAVYTGAMTMNLVKEGEAKIEQMISHTPHPVVLYDTLAMDPPSMDLAMEMKAFDKRVQPRILRSATAVSDAKTAFMAKVAFVFARDHRVFYADREGALRWLQEAVTAAQRKSAMA